MKKIGFVDYFFGNWHSMNYPVWMAEICEKEGYEFTASYAWAELDTSPVNGVKIDDWCEKFAAERCTSLEELCERSDVIIIMAPGAPEKHLQYAETVLRYGKPTFVDKTFAENLASAEKMFALAAAHGTPLFSSSALRYAPELEYCEGCRQVMTTGNGASLEEYIVHQIEMVVRKLGVGAAELCLMETGIQKTVHIRYSDDRAAMMHYAPTYLPFGIHMFGGDTKGLFFRIESEYFKSLTADILHFWDSGISPVPAQPTIEAIRIRDGVLHASAQPGQWIRL